MLLILYSQVYLIAKDCQATFQNSDAHQNAKCSHFFCKKNRNEKTYNSMSNITIAFTLYLHYP